jgi:alkylhydroperoxidase family enzyme
VCSSPHSADGATVQLPGMTRSSLSDRSDPVPDDVWAEAARHYTEQELAALVLWIATANLFNRLNATTSRRC